MNTNDFAIQIITLLSRNENLKKKIQQALKVKTCMWLINNLIKMNRNPK